MTRLIDSVQLNGWTSDTVTRAVRRLTVGPCADPDEAALAQELLRWLRCAATKDAAGLASEIEDLRPAGDDASAWEKLVTLLSDEPIDDIVAKLRRRYSDPVSELCALLDVALPSDYEREFLDPDYLCAFEALIVLGTADSLRYVLMRITLLVGEDIELERLVQPHLEAFVRTAIEVWETLTWYDRSSLVLVFSDHQLPTAPFVELLLAVDGEALEALDFKERIQYVQALRYTDDSRAMRRIHRLLDHALEAPAQLDKDGKEFVAETVFCFGPQELTADQCRRAAECGIQVHAPGSSDAIH